MSNIVSAAASWDTSLTQDSLGNLFFWGQTGTAENPLTPILLGSLPPIRAISQGYSHSVAMGLDGSRFG